MKSSLNFFDVPVNDQIKIISRKHLQMCLYFLINLSINNCLIYLLSYSSHGDTNYIYTQWQIKNEFPGNPCLLLEK